MTAAMDLDGNCETAKALRFTLVSLGPKVPPDYHWKLQHYPIHCMPYQSQRALKLPPFCRNCCRSTIPILVTPRSCCYHIQVSQRVLNQARTSKVSAKLEWFHEEFETAGASIVPSAGLCEFLSENFLISVISAYLSFVAVN